MQPVYIYICSVLVGFSPFFLTFEWQLGAATTPCTQCMARSNRKMFQPLSIYAQIWNSFTGETYVLVWTELSVQYERRKAIYNQRIHRITYDQGDMVCCILLMWVMVFRRSCSTSWRRHFVYLSMYPIASDDHMKRLSMKQVHIIHFDCLMLCTPGQCPICLG